jgi:hypothetical protein
MPNFFTLIAPMPIASFSMAAHLGPLTYSVHIPCARIHLNRSFLPQSAVAHLHETPGAAVILSLSASSLPSVRWACFQNAFTLTRPPAGQSSKAPTRKRRQFGGRPERVGGAIRLEKPTRFSVISSIMMH